MYCRARSLPRMELTLESRTTSFITGQPDQGHAPVVARPQAARRWLVLHLRLSSQLSVSLTVSWPAERFLSCARDASWLGAVTRGLGSMLHSAEAEGNLRLGMRMRILGPAWRVGESKFEGLRLAGFDRQPRASTHRGERGREGEGGGRGGGEGVYRLLYRY